MKVLWLVNILLPAQCARLELPIVPVGGWIEGMMAGLKGSDVSLLILALTDKVKAPCFFEEDGVGYIALQKQPDMQAAFANVLEEHQPDLVHIFGTEMKHSYDMMQVLEPKRAMVQIQGLATQCASLFCEGLSHRFQCSEEERQGVAAKKKGFDIFYQQELLRQGGVYERETLSKTHHVLGHTNWDYAHSQQLAPQAQYHQFAEILRKEFYTDQWSYENCRPYSIFMSQVASPIKGAHMLFQALPGIVRDFPDTQVYVGGFYPDFYSYGYRTKECEYYTYLQNQLRELGVHDHVTFLGVMSPESMKEQYLKANVFASCSIIENESNSLSEAKILGVPCVASYVGGVADRIEHGKDGFFYPYAEPSQLQYYIRKIFEDPQLAGRLSENARKKAHTLNDPRTAAADVLKTYERVYNQL